MSLINDARLVRAQYSRPDGLNTRISLHEKYSENRQSFGDWIISHYAFPRNGRALELGCGTGVMWRGHLDEMPGCELVLSDLSEAMLETARKNLGERPGLSYALIDIQDIPFPDASFDAVIANMMLYHVPDLRRGLSEARRVLKPGGAFYCATFGEHGHNWHIARMLETVGARYLGGDAFTLQNGAEKLSPFFKEVTRYDRTDALNVTDAGDLVDYVLSCTSITGLDGVDPEGLRALFEAAMTDGVLHLPKEYGLFVCR